jgi:hypothetical protein
LVKTMVNPLARFKYFKLAVLDEHKAEDYVWHSLNDEYHLSDEDKIEKNVWLALWTYFSLEPEKGLHIPIEVGDNAGYISFLEVKMGFKCRPVMVIWDWDKIWGPDFAREARELFALIQDMFDLKKMEAKTADPRSVKMLRMLGFKQEGKLEDSFSKNGELIPVYWMGWRRN